MENDVVKIHRFMSHPGKEEGRFVVVRRPFTVECEKD